MRPLLYSECVTISSETIKLISLIASPSWPAWLPYHLTLRCNTNWVDDWYLFRGTFYLSGTSTIFPGGDNNPGPAFTPVTTDPMKATIFATEASNHGDGIVMIFNVGDLLQLGIGPGNMGTSLVELEAEMSVMAPYSTTASKAFTIISVDRAKDILRGMGHIAPRRVTLATLSEELSINPSLTGAEIEHFVKEAQR